MTARFPINNVALHDAFGVYALLQKIFFPSVISLDVIRLHLLTPEETDVAFNSPKSIHQIHTRRMISNISNMNTLCSNKL